MYAWYDDTHISSKAEHTWVTTYQPGTGKPKIKEGDYWFCNGDERDEINSYAVGEGGADFARKIAKPNDRTADVGISYGKDGVCHQMANRLLRFSFNEKGKPLKVEFAKCYDLTVAMYGEYGDKKFASKESKILWENMVFDHLKGEGYE